VKSAIPSSARGRTIIIAEGDPNKPVSRARGGTVFVICCALVFVIIAAAAAYFLSRLF
jgi:hypothetical protein